MSREAGAVEEVKPTEPCFYCEDEETVGFRCEHCGYVVPEPAGETS